ncbi:MAG: hypothetical protein H6Q51_2051 [Deltaproteobacteria bacterium]|nr:hypothetical protein [Deltaproteobacteria bacterium]
MEPERKRGQAASLDLTIPSALEGLGIDTVSASESFQIMKGNARVASDGVIWLVNEVYLAQVSRRIVEVRGIHILLTRVNVASPTGFEPVLPT